jgi:thiol:disulfide interchange protein DsbD
MWMVRFKQFSGFVLLGTVLFLMYSLDQRLVMPMLLVLLGLSLLLWMIGNLYNEVSPAATKWRVRISAIVLSAPMLWFGLMPVVEPLLPKQDAGKEIAAELPWEPFSEQRMMELREQGVPTLIDFTADWCGICKQNELLALNTFGTAEFVKKHGVVTLVADYTSESPEIRKWLNKFGQDTVPLTIIFPKGTDRKLIALRGAYFKSGLLKQLERAVSAGSEAEPSDDPASSSITSNDVTRAASSP